CIFCCYSAHDRSLARVAVTACTEYHNKPAASIGPQTFERFLERVRLVGIVDENRRAIIGTGKFQPAFGADELFQCRKSTRRLGSGCDRKTRRHGRVLHLEGANERQFDIVCPTAVANGEDLRKTLDRSADAPNRFDELTKRAVIKATLLRSFHHPTVATSVKAI